MGLTPEIQACLSAVPCEACTTDRLPPAHSASAPYSLALQGPSLLSWDGSRPGKLGCFLKAALLAGLGLWLSSLPASLPPSPSFTF